VLAAYRSLQAAGDAVAQVVASGLLPGALEIMDRLAIQAAEAAVHANYPAEAAALLIVELDGEAEQVEEEFKRLKVLIEASGRTGSHRRREADRSASGRDEERCRTVGRLSPTTS
jgi:glycolate oxidase